MKQKTIDILNNITASVPEDLRNNLMKKTYTMPVMREIALQAMKDDEVDESLKSRLTNLLNAGYLDEETEEVDTDVARQIDEYIESEILKAIEEKKLPKSNFRGLIKKAKKQLKHGNTQQTN